MRLHNGQSRKMGCRRQMMTSVGKYHVPQPGASMIPGPQVWNRTLRWPRSNSNVCVLSVLGVLHVRMTTRSGGRNDAPCHFPFPFRALQEGCLRHARRVTNHPSGNRTSSSHARHRLARSHRCNGSRDLPQAKRDSLASSGSSRVSSSPCGRILAALPRLLGPTTALGGHGEPRSRHDGCFVARSKGMGACSNLR